MGKKENLENIDLLKSLEQLMEDFSIPDCLREKTIKILETKKKTMSDEEVYRYLEQLGSEEINTLPVDLMNEKWLQSVYASDSEWVEEEVDFFVKASYEPFDEKVEASPPLIRGMSQNAQKSYIAISSNLFNIFSQIDDIFYQKKTTKPTKNEDDFSTPNKVSRSLKVVFGNILMLIGYIFALVAFILSGEEGMGAYLTIYLFMAMLPFLIGLFLLKDVTLKNFYKHTVFRGYFYLSFIVPIAFMILINFDQWKKDLLYEPDFILLHLASNEWISVIEYALFAILIISTGYIIFQRKHLKKLLLVFSISFIIFAGVQYVSFKDYQAIATDGVIHSSFGSKETYEWGEVEGVHLYGKTESFGTGTSRSEEFRWSFEFHMENGDTILFDPFSYREGPIEESIKIKNKMETENIPMKIEPLTEEDRTLLEVGMDYEEAELKEEFFKLFEIDSF
ncbi:hypothetical protein [Saliterribacillus persicus]|uniref:Uncharacterized protein n=1 Tax=Saliterribacillus persicus TaxID=930114 RepID=A0A368YFQ0_9BACI|nr:hypothetical protein [Saliterribacillus persicus]RCW77014.1 hypothetical protein DFR57_102289 [Saliterribacillus persicus]